MGVTIHYRGTLDDPGNLDQLRRELADIGKSMGWETNALEDSWQDAPTARLEHRNGVATIKGHLGLKGITLHTGNNAESQMSGMACSFLLYTSTIRSRPDISSIFVRVLPCQDQFWQQG